MHVSAEALLPLLCAGRDFRDRLCRMAYAGGIYAHVPPVAAAGASEAEEGVCEFELSKEIEDERELYKIVVQGFLGDFYS